MSLNYQAREICAAGEIDATTTASAAVFTDALATAKLINPMRKALEAARIKQLISNCAWTDAALSLLTLEQPHWQLRRLAYDDGEWHCALSKHRDMPEWLDIDIETHHADMALAILGAVSQARKESAARPEFATGSATPDAFWEPTPCDNYA